MSVGPDYFEKLLDAATMPPDSDIKLQHCVQTNGTLISDEFCSLFVKVGMRVGVSLDGPKEIHDKRRLSRSGHGTFDKVMMGIERLKRHGIPFHTIAVLSRETIDQPEYVYDFFAEIGSKSIGFNMDEIEGENKNSELAELIDTKKIDLFWRRLFAHHIKKKSLYLREFDDFIQGIAFYDANHGSNLIDPYKIITVGYDGNCSTFSPELIGSQSLHYNDFCIGNINDGSLRIDGIEQNIFFQKLHNDINMGVKKCASECSYFDICGGGSPSNKYTENGSLSSSETLYCKIMKKSVIDNVIHVVDEFRKWTHQT